MLRQKTYYNTNNVKANYKLETKHFSTNDMRKQKMTHFNAFLSKCVSLNQHAAMEHFSNLTSKYLPVQSTLQRFWTNSNYHSSQLKANTSAVTLYVMIITKMLNLRMTEGPISVS